MYSGNKLRVVAATSLSVAGGLLGSGCGEKPSPPAAASFDQVLKARLKAYQNSGLTHPKFAAEGIDAPSINAVGEEGLIAAIEKGTRMLNKDASDELGASRSRALIECAAVALNGLAVPSDEEYSQALRPFNNIRLDQLGVTVRPTPQQKQHAIQLFDDTARNCGNFLFVSDRKRLRIPLGLKDQPGR